MCSLPHLKMIISIDIHLLSMMKIPQFIFAFFAFFAIEPAFSQDQVTLFYINKIQLTQADSTALSACKTKEFKTVSLEIYVQDKNGKVDSIFSAGSDFHWWKDSVVFSYNIPKNLYQNNASISLHPVYQIACSGLNGNRGVENVEADGESNTVRNINVKFVSNPPGATVYLIPKLMWQRTPALSGKKDPAILGRYLLYNGVTPVNAMAQEYVYIALFKFKDKFIPVECSPTHFKMDDMVFANFIQ